MAIAVDEKPDSRQVSGSGLSLKYTVQGTADLAGAMAALLGSILPPTALMLGVVLVLHRLRREAWVSRFVEGLSPAVAVLMVYIAFKLLLSVNQSAFNWPMLIVALGSLVAFLLEAPPPIVLLAAGVLGIFLFR